MTDSEKHTPGPWTVHHRCRGCTEQDDEQLGLGLEVVGPEPASGRGDYARAADARLIAAAPDLLEALREVEAIMMTVEPRSDKAEYLAGRQRVLAAIAKAEGREGGDHE
jgi:hypothetical protein